MHYYLSVWVEVFALHHHHNNTHTTTYTNHQHAVIYSAVDQGTPWPLVPLGLYHVGPFSDPPMIIGYIHTDCTNTGGYSNSNRLRCWHAHMLTQSGHSTHSLLPAWKVAGELLTAPPDPAQDTVQTSHRQDRWQGKELRGVEGRADHLKQTMWPLSPLCFRPLTFSDLWGTCATCSRICGQPVAMLHRVWCQIEYVCTVHACTANSSLGYRIKDREAVQVATTDCVIVSLVPGRNVFPQPAHACASHKESYLHNTYS